MKARVVAYVSDLIFSTKIASTARAMGVEIQIVRSLEALGNCLRGGAVDLTLIDLNAAGDDPIQALRLTREVSPATRTVAYLSHVQTELADAARQAGADEVLPRSAFSTRLPALLKPDDAP